MADPLPDPSNVPDPTDVTNILHGAQLGARLRALGDLDADPDEGAEAQKLSTTTGVPSGTVIADFDAFKNRHKQALADDIIRVSSHMQDYINSHPLATKVSNDDWGNLGDLEEAMDHFKKAPLTSDLRAFIPGLTALDDATKPVLAAMIAGGHRAFGDQSLLSPYPAAPGADPSKPEPSALEFALGRGVYQPAEYLGQNALAIAMRLLGAGFGGAAGGIGEIGRELGRKEAPEEADAIADALQDPAVWASIPPLEGLPVGQAVSQVMRALQDYTQRGDQVVKFEKVAGRIDKAAQAAEIAEPYLDAHKLPPPGADKAFDDLHREAAGDAAKAFQNVIAAVGKTNTAARSDELLKAFLDTWPEARIGVDAKAVQRLYGDKVPGEGGGPFDFLPDIAQQLDHAAQHGGDVEIPLNDWLSRLNADPALADTMKDLRDDVRMHPGMVTINEGKALRESVAAAPEPEEPQGWHLADEETHPSGRIEFDIRYGEHSFGALHLAEEDGGKTLHIDYVDTGGRGSLGPHAIRALLDQLQERFPEAERLRGLRVSGARDNPAEVAINLRKQTKLGPPDGWESAGGIMKDPRFDTPQFGLDKLEPSDFDVPTSTGGRIRAIGKLSVKDALGGIDAEAYGTGIQRQLHDFFSGRLSEKVGDTPIYIVRKEDMDKFGEDIGRTGKDAVAGQIQVPGFYNGDHHAIFLDERTLTGGMSYTQAAGVIRHEAMHALTWHAIEASPRLQDILRKAQREVKAWIKEEDPEIINQAGIDYGLSGNLHEFMTQATSDPRFQEILASTPISKSLSVRLGVALKGGATVWDAIREVVRGIMEKAFGVKVPDTMLDGVIKLEQEFEEEYAKRQASGKAIAGGEAAPRAPRDEAAPRWDIPVKRLKQYQDLIAKQRAELNELERTRGEALERQRQTQEWKEAYETVRNEIRTNLRRRPDLAADLLLREGELYGEKVGRIRFERETIPPELRDKLPPDYLADRGVHPANIASMFGYGSGDQLVEALARLESERRLEDLTPAAHLSKIVSAEADRATRARLGNPEDNVLEAAKEHITSQTQMDILAEEIQALALRAGKDAPPFTQGEAKRNVKVAFDGMPTAAHDSNKYLQSARKAGDAVEAALLDRDAAGAYKAKQEQWAAVYKAKLARDLERQRRQFDTRVAGWVRREPPGISQADALWIHDILRKIGIEPKRSLQDWQRQRQLVDHTHDDLRSYVNDINAQNRIYNQDPDAAPVGQLLPVADFLLDDRYAATVDGQSVNEFKDTFNSLKAIDKFSRDDKKLLVKGQKEDLGLVVQGFAQRIKAAVGNARLTSSAQQAESVQRTIGSWLFNPETWFKRLDLGNVLGPFTQLILRPVTEARYQLATFEREFRKLMDKYVGDFPDADKAIDNTLFRDPQEGYLVKMNKGNAYAVLSNMGNALQREKLVLGWRIAKSKEQVPAAVTAVWRWLERVGMGPEDLARAQRLGDVFEKAFEHSEKAYTGINGVAPARIDLFHTPTPWGEAEEWYHPLIPDPLRHPPSLDPDQMLGESGFYRPSPASGYTKTRTGATYPIDLSLQSVPFKLKQILTDAAMRPAITDVSKIVFHPDFASAFKNYYGTQYYDALTAWLKDAAGNRQWVPGNLRAFDRWASALQQNLSTLLIGMNPGTVMKHSITAAIFSGYGVGAAGMLPYLNEMKRLALEAPGSRERFRWAQENSEEIANRLHSMAESLTGMDVETIGGRRFVEGSPERSEAVNKIKRKLGDFRELARYYGSQPVAISDLWSATAMWLTEYERLAQEDPNLSHGDLVYQANTAVRQTHGSSLLTNRSSLMRSTQPLVRMTMPFYNFFNNALQRNYELAWRAKLLAKGGAELPEMKGFEAEKFKTGPAEVAKVIGGLMVYGIVPSLIETAVEKLMGTEAEEGPGYFGHMGHWANILGRAYPAMIPGVRDFFNAWQYGRDPGAGMLGTAAHNLTHNLKPSVFLRDPGEAFHAANSVAGTLTGLTWEPAGKAGKFLFNMAAGKEHPKGLGDIWRGLTHGTMEKHR